MKRLLYILILLLPAVVVAQAAKPQAERTGPGALLYPLQPNLERLAAKATESVDVTLDGPMLKFAGKFLNDNDPEEQQTRKLVEGLKGIYVRSFEFAKPGEYTPEDVESLRSLLKPPVWTRVVGVRSAKQNQNADVYFKMENGNVMGLAIIATEPQELTFVHIDGPLDPAKLDVLGGRYGIPKVEVPKAKSKAPTGEVK